MNFIFFKLLIFFPLFVNNVLSASPKPNTLQHVHVLFRHGDRTPDLVSMYPKDPYINDTWHPHGLGSLTNLGKKQILEMGRSLRRRYGQFLGDVYLPKLMEARSTSVPRAKMSMLVALAGLWPPTALQKFERTLSWQPIDFSFKPFDRDELLGFPLVRNCEAYVNEYIKTISSDETEAYFKENKEKIDYINENSGLNVTNALQLLSLYFGLYAEKHTNRKLPKWTEKIFPEFLEEATILEYKLQTYTDDLLKYNGGVIVKQILLDAKSKINEDTSAVDKKIYLYSGHEFNIAHTLRALKIYEPHIPQYASHIIFELHQINSKFGFMVFYHYQDVKHKKPELMKIPGCEEFCLIDDFEKLMLNIMPDENTKC